MKYFFQGSQQKLSCYKRGSRLEILIKIVLVSDWVFSFGESSNERFLSSLDYNNIFDWINVFTVVWDLWVSTIGVARVEWLCRFRYLHCSWSVVFDFSMTVGDSITLILSWSAFDVGKVGEMFLQFLDFWIYTWTDHLSWLLWKFPRITRW